jgi:SAM-dependent methyltransferase
MDPDDLHRRIQAWWDEDAATYDHDPGHAPDDALELAAWRQALSSRLPPPPARVLDVGAGTGFLSLLLAELGYQVTALDLSSEMLARLAEKAEGRGLEVRVVNGMAEDPPPGPFDAVVERHLLWTLPDPKGALVAWRQQARSGAVLASFRTSSTDPLDQARAGLRRALSRLAGRPAHGHHAPLDPAILQALPHGPHLDERTLASLVAEAGWRAPRLDRCTEIEWARSRVLPLPERLVGSDPCLVLLAEAP